MAGFWSSPICVFIDRDEIESIKTQKKRPRPVKAILTVQVGQLRIYYMANKRTFSCRTNMGNPEMGPSCPLGSKSERGICFILPAREFSHLLETLRSNDVTATRTSLKKWICFLSVFITTISTHLLSQMWRTLQELNSHGPYPSSGKEIKFRRCLFTKSIKRAVVVKKLAKKCAKSVMHVQICCFA